jgi:hypothetical protein
LRILSCINLPITIENIENIKKYIASHATIHTS